MQIDPVAADPHRVRERLGRQLVLALLGQRHPRIRPDVLFKHGELRLKAARLANVGVLGKPVFRADDVRPQPQPFPALAPIRPRGCSLHPIEQRETELLGSLEMARGFLLAYFLNIA